MSAKSGVSVKDPNTKTAARMVAPLDTTTTVDDDLISWSDLSLNNSQDPNVKTTAVFIVDDIDIFSDDDDTNKGNVEQIDEAQVTSNTTQIDEPTDETAPAPAHESSEFGRNAIFQMIKYTLDSNENLANWVGLGTVGATDTRTIKAGNLNLEVSITYIGTDEEETVTEKSETVAKSVIKEKSLTDTQATTSVRASIETRPKLTVGTSKATNKQLRDTVLTSPLPAIISPSAASPHTSKVPVACRFGANCTRRDTCTFDHGEATRKKMCTFVNTAAGCKNAACAFSHDHLGVMCMASRYRSNCPNTHKCGFKHQDDDVAVKTAPKKTTKSQEDGQLNAEVAQKAALARVSREVPVAAPVVPGPPLNAPTGPQRGVKRGRVEEDGDEGRAAQRPRGKKQQKQQQQGRARGPKGGRGPGDSRGNGRGGRDRDMGFSIRGAAGEA